MNSRASTLALKVAEKTAAIDNFNGFIDGTVIEISRPELQNVDYNGHERKHALKFQAVTIADEII